MVMRPLLAALFVLGVGLSPVAAEDPQTQREAPQRCLKFEVRIVSVPAEANLIGVPAAEGGVAFLDDGQLKDLLAGVSAHPAAQISELPRVTADSGQNVTVVINQRREFFARRLEAVMMKGTPVLVPIKEPVDFGQTLALVGRLSADGRMVKTGLKYANTYLGSEGVAMVPVTASLPDAEGKRPIVFTQYLEVPDLRTLKIEKAELVLPAGGHAVLTGPMSEVLERKQFGPPVLSDLPFINRLFSNVGYSRQKFRTFAVVTAHVVSE